MKKAVIDISRAGARADADRARRLVSRGMLIEGKPYEVIGDTEGMYIDRFLILKDELGHALILHESMLVPYEIWLAERRESNLHMLFDRTSQY